MYGEALTELVQEALGPQWKVRDVIEDDEDSADIIYQNALGHSIRVNYLPWIDEEWRIFVEDGDTAEINEVTEQLEVALNEAAMDGYPSGGWPDGPEPDIDRNPTIDDDEIIFRLNRLEDRQDMIVQAIGDLVECIDDFADASEAQLRTAKAQQEQLNALVDIAIKQAVDKRKSKVPFDLEEPVVYTHEGPWPDAHFSALFNRIWRDMENNIK